MQKKLVRLILCLLILMFGLSFGLTAQDEDEEAQQETVVSEEGRFSITLPSGYPEAAVTTKDVETAMGQVKLTVFISAVKDAFCMVVFNDYSAADMKGKDSDAILNGARDGALKNLNGTLEDEDEYTLDGYPGRRIYFSSTSDNDAIYGQSVFLLVKNRLYQVVFIGSDKKAPKKTEIRAFFKSFKLEAATKDKTWDSDEWNYEVTLPPDWQVKQLDKGDGVPVMEFSNNDKSFKGHIEIETKEGRCDDFINAVIEGISETYKIKILEKPEGESEATVVYTAVVDGEKRKYYWRVIDANGEKMRFVVYCAKSDYDEYEELFQKYAATLKGIKPKRKNIPVKQKDKTWSSERWGFEVTFPVDWELKIKDKKDKGSRIVANAVIDDSFELGICVDAHEGRCDDYNDLVIEENLTVSYETEILDATKGKAEATATVKGINKQGAVLIFYLYTIDVGGTKLQVLACIAEGSYNKYKDVLAKYAKTLKAMEE